MRAFISFLGCTIVVGGTKEEERKWRSGRKRRRNGGLALHVEITYKSNISAPGAHKPVLRMIDITSWSICYRIVLVYVQTLVGIMPFTRKNIHIL